MESRVSCEPGCISYGRSSNGYCVPTRDDPHRPQHLALEGLYLQLLRVLDDLYCNGSFLLVIGPEFCTALGLHQGDGGEVSPCTGAVIYDEALYALAHQPPRRSQDPVERPHSFHSPEMIRISWDSTHFSPIPSFLPRVSLSAPKGCPALFSPTLPSVRSFPVVPFHSALFNSAQVVTLPNSETKQ